MTEHAFTLDRSAHDFVELHNLLKLTGVAPSGGAAKAMVAEGLVRVDGEIELRKTRKLRGGETVRVGGETIVVGAG